MATHDSRRKVPSEPDQGRPPERRDESLVPCDCRNGAPRIAGLWWLDAAFLAALFLVFAIMGGAWLLMNGEGSL